jgi:hypothetical protein
MNDINPTSITIDDDTARNVNKLHEALTRLQNQPNVLTLAEFSRYEPIFRNVNRTKDDKAPAVHLADEYIRRINMYKPTVIIASETDRRPVVVLPPIFTPLKPLEPNPTNEALVNRHATARASGQLEFYKEKAFADMAQTFLNEQSKNTQVIGEYQKQYAKIMNRFIVTYGKIQLPEPDVTQKIDEPPKLTNIDWEDD